MEKRYYETAVKCPKCKKDVVLRQAVNRTETEPSAVCACGAAVVGIRVYDSKGVHLEVVTVRPL